MALSVDAAFRHCPRCGGAPFASSGGNAMRCARCALTWYRNVAAAVDVIVRNPAGHVLITVRAREPGRGKLDFPGGFVDFDETLEAAARREVLEETGVELAELTYFGSFPNRYEFGELVYPALDVIFLARTDAGEIRAADDVSSLSFRDPRTLEADDFGLASTRQAFAAYRAHLDR